MARKQHIIAGGALALALLLAGCSESSAGDGDIIAAPAPTPTPTPTPPAIAFDVTPCLTQRVPGTNFSVADLVIPDTLTVDFSQASGFPNGRDLDDPVLDVVLAAIFLDLDAPGQSPASFASIPLNPPANDRPFSDSFPYLAAPQGTPPIASSNGVNFTFNNADPAQFVRVERFGFPAVPTALIGGDRQIAYNEANTADDLDGEFASELTEQLTLLTNGLADDLQGLNFTICAESG